MAALQQFRVIFKSVKKHFHWVEKQTGVSGAQLWALAAVVEEPGLTVSGLAKALAIHQTTTSNLIDKLIKQKFIRRERNPEDKRIIHLLPELRGIQLVKMAPKPIKGVLPDALAKLPAAELSQLTQLLSHVAHRMKVRDSTGKSTHLADI